MRAPGHTCQLSALPLPTGYTFSILAGSQGWCGQVEDGEAETMAQLWAVSFVPVHGHGNTPDPDPDLDHWEVEGEKHWMDEPGSSAFMGTKLKSIPSEELPSSRSTPGGLRPQKCVVSVLEPGSVESRCQQDQAPSETCKGESPCLLVPSEVAGSPWSSVAYRCLLCLCPV